VSWRLVACACAGSLLGACGALPVEKPEPEPEPVPAAPVQTVSPRRTSDVENLVAYYQQVRRLAPVEFGREHEAARQAYLSSRSDYNRVRLALLLSQPGTAFLDESRALELLDPVARNPSAQLNGLATLLTANLQERKRLDASAQGLQHKLDALRALERSMLEKKR